MRNKNEGHFCNLLFFVFIIGSLLFPFIPKVVYASDTTSSVNIHFFSLKGNASDAILLESTDSDGTKHFGMIDAGEDWDFPDGSDPRYPLRSFITTHIGFEDSIINYLEQYGVTSENFEFLLGTHAHSDHIGGADSIIRKFKPKTVYLQEYRDDFLVDDHKRFDNQYVYDQMIEATNEVGSKLIQYFKSPEEFDSLKLSDHSQTELPFDSGSSEGIMDLVPQTSENTACSVFHLGESMELEVLNYDDRNLPILDTNNLSLTVKITAFGRTILLAGDTNNDSDNPYDATDLDYGGFDEDKLMASGKVDNIDIYKLSHHGLIGSNTLDFLRTVNPKIVVQLGFYDYLSKDKIMLLADELNSTFYSTSSYKEVSALVFHIDHTGTITNNIPAKDFVLSNTKIATYYKSGVPTAHTGLLTLENENQEQHIYLFEKNSTHPVTSAFIETSDGIYYYNPLGYQIIDDWYFIDGKWYHFDDSGKMQTGWFTENDKTYYLTPDGWMATSWYEIDKSWYYFDKTGVLTKGWLTLNGKTYYLDDLGVLLHGWNTIDGTLYHFDDSGAMSTKWSLIEGSWYYFSNSGKYSTGWQTIDSKRHYFASNGIMQVGWKLIDKKWYYFNENGSMAIGWKIINKKWYYLNNSGIMQTGWLNNGGKWYYFNISGVMLTGWVKDNNIWYYTNTSGAMKTGWVKDNKKWYYMNTSGAMKTGWIKDNGKWYYLNSSGVMLTGWIKDGTKWYYSNTSGVMLTGWLSYDGSRYYLQNNGVMAIGRHVINGITYYFRTNGTLI